MADGSLPLTLEGYRAIGRRTAQIPRWALLATVGVVGTSILVALLAAMTRGPWIDEFWTVFAADPRIPLAVAVETRWLTDVHPPLFYALARYATLLLGDDIPVLRLLNLPAMLGLIAFFGHAAAVWRNARRFLLVYAVLVFSSYFATGYFAEYRSYYWQFAASVGLFGIGYALLRDDVLVRRRHRWTYGFVFAGCAVLLINLHFIAAAMAEIAIGAMALAAWIEGRRTLAGTFVAVGMAAALPLVATLVKQAPYLIGTSSGGFWITTGLVGALQVLVGSIAKGIGLNLAACGLAAWALGSGRIERSSDARIGIAFIIAAAAGGTLLLAVNFYRPVVIDRYLLVSSAATCCGLAILAQDVAFTLRAGFAAIVLNAVVFLGIAADKLAFEPRWNASAAILADRVAACPTTDIMAFPFPYRGTLKSESEVFASAYAYLAERYGFQVRMVRPGDRPTPSRLGCPTLLWTEHVPWTVSWPEPTDRLVLDAAAAAFDVPDLAGFRVIRTKTGAVIVPSGERKPE